MSLWQNDTIWLNLEIYVCSYISAPNLLFVVGKYEIRFHTTNSKQLLRKSTYSGFKSSESAVLLLSIARHHL